MPAAVGCPRIAFPLLAKASMDEPPALAACSEVQREQALAHFCILKPFLAGPLPLSAVARAERVPVCTLQRWVTRYWQQGLKGLMRTRRTDQGKRVWHQRITT